MIRLTQCLCMALLLVSPLALAVPVYCTPDEITLGSQAEVDDFQANHGPGCDTIVSRLTITGASITDLSPLAGLTTIDWNSWLTISGTSVVSLAGLDGLTSVFSVDISNNALLTDITALFSIGTHTGALFINGNTLLTNLNGLDNVTELPVGGLFIENNPSLTDLGGVSNITSIGASLVIGNNDALVDLNDLAGLTHVPSNMSINNNDALTDISALGNLVDFDAVFYLRLNSQLTQLGDLSNMTGLDGLIIWSNNLLNNVDGLSGLKTVADTGLAISYNNSLSNLDGLAGLESSDANVEISNNPMLDQCSALQKLLDAVDDAQPGPGPGVAGIPDVNGDVTVENNDEGCNSVSDIVGAPPLSLMAGPFHYGGLEPENQHLMLKGSSIIQNCLGSAIGVAHGGQLYMDRLLYACTSVFYKSSDTLIYDAAKDSCQTLEDFRSSTRLDIHGTYLANQISGSTLQQNADVQFKYDPKALLQFDPMTGEVRSIESMVCDFSTEIQPPPDVLGQLDFLKAHNAGADDNFGDRVAVSGNTVVVGAKAEDGGATVIDGTDDDLAASAGAAYVYVREAGTNNWVQQAYLKASNGEGGDRFGADVAIDGDTIVVGADNEDGAGNASTTSGAAYVFVRNGESWTEQSILRASDAASGDWFGGDVAISGDTIVVGAYRENQAFVYTRSGTTWTEQQILVGSNTASGDNFGRGVTIDGDTIVVGAFFEDSDATGVNGSEDNNNANNSGAAYVFTRNTGTWTQQAYVKASNTDQDDLFGAALSLSGDTLAVGVYHESSNATGIDGDQSNNGLLDSGAAYIFVRNGETWSQQAYVKASNTGFQDSFGEAISLSGDLLAVPAAREDSNSVDDQANGAATDSGAVYIFSRDGATWSQLAYLKASNLQSEDWFGRDVSISDSTMAAGAFFEDSSTGGGEDDNSVLESGAAYVFNITSNIVDPDVDVTPPVVTAPADISGFEATGTFTPVVLGEASVTDDSGEILTAVADFTGPFLLGITGVYWIATDSSGNVGYAEQLVEVVDTTPPLITAPDDLNLPANGLRSNVYLGNATVSDAAGVVASLENDAPDDFPVGLTLVTWTATDASGNSASDTQNVIITPPEVISTSYSSQPVHVDGDLDYGEWGYWNPFNFNEGYLLFKNDKDRLYVLVNVLNDDNHDPLVSAGGDRLTFYFDVNEDGFITPDVDIRYVLDDSTGNLQLETRCDGCPGGFNPPEAVTLSSRAEGFGCFLGDGTASMIPLSCDRHKVWELAFDMAEIGVREDNATRFGFEVSSGSPTLLVSYPADPDQVDEYIQLNLAQSGSVRQKEDFGPGSISPEFEVTQAIQTPDNSIDLVAGRRTAVRVWEGSTYDDVKVYIYGSRGGVDLPGSPILRVGSIKGFSPGGRGGIGYNIFKVLSDSWSSGGTVDFDVLVLGLDDSIAAELFDSVGFVHTREPVFWTVPLRSNFPDNISFEPDDNLVTLAEETLRRVAPISEIQFVRKPMHNIYNASTHEELIEQLREFDQMTFLSWFLGLAINGVVPFELPEQVTGFTKQGFVVPEGTITGSSDPVGLGGDGRVAWARQTTAEDSMLYAHELNHNLDQAVPWTWGRHIIGCGAQGTDPNWPYGSSIRIQEVGVYPTGQWFSSVDEDTPDFMSYCGSLSTPAQWFSPYRWEAWVDEFESVAPGSAENSKRSAAHLNAAGSLVNPVDSFYVSGRVYSNGDGEFTQILRQPGIADAEGLTGAYVVRVEDCADGTLAENSFPASFTGPEDELLEFVSFSFILPAPDQSCSIRLYLDSQLLDEQIISASAPSVAVTMPNGGELWDGQGVVTWTANDPDGDPLLFTVLYSGDEGLTWRVLDSKIESTQLIVDTQGLNGTDSALIRVLATDGGNTGSDDSDGVFTVADPGLGLEIISPTQGAEFNTAQTIELGGRGRFPSGETWPDQQLLWSTTGGIAGQGARLSIRLEEGVHPISLIAIDGLAIVAVETVEIIVSDEPGSIFFSQSVAQVDEKAGEISIGVTRSGAAIGPARVQYFTMDDVAVSGGDPLTGQNDYVAIAQDPAHQLEWADGETGTRYFTVQVNEDVAIEDPERFNVLIEAVEGEVLGTSIMDVYIISETMDLLFRNGFE